MLGLTVNLWHLEVVPITCLYALLKWCLVALSVVFWVMKRFPFHIFCSVPQFFTTKTTSPTTMCTIRTSSRSWRSCEWPMMIRYVHRLWSPWNWKVAIKKRKCQCTSDNGKKEERGDWVLCCFIIALSRGCRKVSGSFISFHH